MATAEVSAVEVLVHDRHEQPLTQHRRVQSATEMLVDLRARRTPTQAKPKPQVVLNQTTLAAPPQVVPPQQPYPATDQLIDDRGHLNVVQPNVSLPNSGPHPTISCPYCCGVVPPPRPKMRPLRRMAKAESFSTGSSRMVNIGDTFLLPAIWHPCDSQGRRS